MLLCAVYMFTQVLAESQFVEFPSVNTMLFVTRYIILGLLALYIIWNNALRRRKMVLLLVLIVLMTVIHILFLNGSTTILGIMLFAIASRGIPLEKIFSTTIISLIVGHLWVVMFCALGRLEDTVDMRYISDITGQFFMGEYNRHSMGFLVSNQIPLAFLITYMLYIVYKKGDVKLIQHIFALGFNLFLFQIFGARIVFALCIITVVLVYLVSIWEHRSYSKTQDSGRSVFASKILCLSPLIFCLISFIVVLNYDEKSYFYNMANLIFNNRIYFAYENIRYLGLALLGSGADAGTTEALLTVDNGYIIMFLQNGIILGSMVLACWIYMGYIAVKQKNFYLLIIIVLLSVENLINSHLINYKMIPMFCILVNVYDSLIARSETKEASCLK